MFCLSVEGLCFLKCTKTWQISALLENVTMLSGAGPQALNYLETGHMAYQLLDGNSEVMGAAYLSWGNVLHQTLTCSS